MKNKKFIILTLILIFIFFLCFFKREYTIIFDYCSFDGNTLESKFVYDYNAFNFGDEMKVVAKISFAHSIWFHFDSNVKVIAKTSDGGNQNIDYGIALQCD